MSDGNGATATATMDEVGAVAVAAAAPAASTEAAGLAEFTEEELLAEAEQALNGAGAGVAAPAAEEDEDDDEPDPAAADLLLPLPPAPGDLLSPFRRCSCIGTLPGRACQSCNNTHWHKICPSPGCNGSGIIYKNSRTGWEPRSERCGFCMGRGTVPARTAEVAEAQATYDLALAEQQRLGRVRLVTDEPGHVFRRRPILPKAQSATQSAASSRKKSAAATAAAAAARR